MLSSIVGPKMPAGEEGDVCNTCNACPDLYWAATFAVSWALFSCLMMYTVHMHNSWHASCNAFTIFFAGYGVLNAVRHMQDTQEQAIT